MAKLFQDGQKVKHLGAHVAKPNKRVRVLYCLNEDDPLDRAAQGYRYLVGYKGQQWSVPEWALRGK